MIYSWAVIDVLFFFLFKGVWRWDMTNSWWYAPASAHNTQTTHLRYRKFIWEKRRNTCRKHYIYLSSLHPAWLDKRQEHMLDRHKARNWTENHETNVLSKYTKILEKTHRVILSGWICHWRVVVQEIRNFFQQFNLIWPLFNQVSVENVF